jgi:hypothetical protein
MSNKGYLLVVSPLDPPIIVFDADIMYKFVYNRDGRLLAIR